MRNTSERKDDSLAKSVEVFSCRISRLVPVTASGNSFDLVAYFRLTDIS